MSIQKEKSSQQEIAEIWKLFRETKQEMRFMSKEADRRFKETERLLKESGQETDRIVKETALQMKDTDRRMKETDRRLKKLDSLFTGHWGKLMEALTTGGLKSALEERNIQITGIGPNIERTYKDQKREFDIIATNGEELVVVEVKTTLQVKQVQYFLENIKSFKNYFPEYKDKKVYGAVAYLKSNESASNYAEKKGLFILNPVGNVVKVVNSVHFRPKQMA